MTLKELLTSLRTETLRLPGETAQQQVAGVAADSRRVQPGFVFVAVRGEKADGHAFARDAVARGALAVVAERPIDLAAACGLAVVREPRAALAALCDAFHGHPSRHLRVTGVTGTKGKSTTCQILRAMIRAAGSDAGLIGTLGYETGRRRVAASMTTPEATDIQAFLAEMVRDGLGYAVMEVSSHSLVQHRVDDVCFAVGVFTQLTAEHLDFHKTLEAYRDAKSLLFQMLEPGACAVLNADDPASDVYARCTAARVVTYGLDRRADYTAEILAGDLNGARYIMHTPSGDVDVDSPLVGKHNVYNALAAAAAARSLGLSVDSVVHGIRQVGVVNGRLDPVRCGQPFDVLIDYAHTHHALEAVLSALRPNVRGRVLVVFGAGGDRDRLKRPKMGDVVSRLADEAWVTSDNPRTEDPDEIIAQICRGASRPERLHVEPDRRQAIRHALDAARPDDLVLIAGKGHESVQIFRDRTVPFDDREVARELLTARAAS